MVQDSVSHRGSFSVPIYINLLNARRNKTRQSIYSMAETNVPSRRREWTSQTPTSSVGEDRAVILGFAMIGFSVLMYFLFGFTIVRPYLNSPWIKESTCKLIQVDVLSDQVDCRDQCSYPCLKVLVNFSHSGREVVLRYKEAAFDLVHKRYKKEVLEETQRIQSWLLKQEDGFFSCYSRFEDHPKEAVLTRKYDGWLVLQCVCWSTLMLLGGVSIVCLVKLTQRLAHMCQRLEAMEGPGG
ncbi:calcium-activated potassium channel subunit beta-3 isoform X2 [Brienomyrus brachyistius]|uniref:calcium-activated potassium channel subunit beta-3 isoform X2 n=1 Tax=Brienomyrus brachyistius TaxID=42636 RepID=UPI0020B27FC0|nr:calcium-activated potassium channel subunit beta-3 isoform X2 [Brienomyrus brachyistius]